jgi:hypothetical protein
MFKRRHSTTPIAGLFTLLGLVGILVGARPALADGCGALGGTFQNGECQVTGPVTRSGGFSIATPLRITSLGSIAIPATTTGNNLTLTVAGNFSIDAPASGQVSIDGNGSGTPSVGATIAIVASGHIVLDGAGSIGAQIRTNGNTLLASGCSENGRAGNISLTSSVANITLAPGTKLTATGGCLGGEIVLSAPSGNIDTRASLLSRPGGTSSTTTAVRGGPITLSAAGSLTIGPNSSITSQNTATGGGTRNYGADRIHLQSAGNMLIQGIVQSLGGANFGTDVFGGQNRCTGASRFGKPATSTSCVELWVGGTLTVEGGDPSKLGNTINGTIIARSGQDGLQNATDPSWIDVHVIGNVLLKGKATANGGASFLFDAQQNSQNARGGTISMFSYSGKITASGRTFVADGATTAGGFGGLVTVEAAGPDEHLPILPPLQYDGRAADLRSNVDLGDSMQFARGANDGDIGGAGKIHVRSYNGQITGGPVTVLAPNTAVTLPAGTVLLTIGTPVTLSVPTAVTLGNSTSRGGVLVKSVDGTAVALPAGTPVTLLGTGATLSVDTVVTPPAGTVANPSTTTLLGGCANRLTGVALIDPSTGQQYPCDDRLGVVDGGGIGQTELIITLCVGWLYNGVTRPLAVTLDHYCGGRPTLPPDVIIPISPTIQIYGGRYQFDNFERPARGSVDSGFITDVSGHRTAAVLPQAYGQSGLSEPLLPLPTVTYVDSSNNPITVPIQVGTYTATAYFPGNSKYMSLTATAPIIIYDKVPIVTVEGGIYRYDGQAHPAGVPTTTDVDTHASINAPPTVVYYNCVFNALPSWTPATDPSCTTTPPVSSTTTKLPPNVTLSDSDAGNWIPVLAYFPGGAGSGYGPAYAAARIAIWKPRPSVTTATGFTVYYDGNPHPTATTVKDGQNDGLSGTYPTVQATVDPGSYTFTGLPSGVTYVANPNLSTVHGVNVQAPIDAGTYPVTAVYPGDDIHSGSSGTNTIIILPRPVRIVVVGGTFACDGAFHPATGSVRLLNPDGSLGAVIGTPDFTYTDSAGNLLSVIPVYPGTYTVTATLSQTLAGNNAATSSVTTTIIIPANLSVITAVGGTYVWDGNAHAATGAVTYNGQPIGMPTFTYTNSAGVVQLDAPVDVGVYTVTATWPSGGNCYIATPATATITIKAPSCTIPTTGPFAYTPIAYPAIGASTSAYGLDSAGHIVGAFVNNTNRSAGFQLSGPAGDFSPPIAATALGANSTAAYGVNLAGRIVGTYLDGSGVAHGFLLTGSTAGVGGTFTRIDVPASFMATQTMVYGINNNNAIVGAYVDSAGKSHGFALSGLTFDLLTGAPSWTTAVFAKIDPLSTLPQTVAYGLNNNGLVVGTYVDSLGKKHGFSVLPIAGNLVDFTGATFKTVDVPNAAGSRVYGVDDANRFVGSYDNSTGATDGFLFDGSAFTIFGAVGSEAHGINNVGQIVGNYVSATNSCGFLTQAPSLCTSGKCATRTPGFWANHTAYTEKVFDTVGIFTVGTSTHMRLIDSYGKLFGAFVSDISKMTTGVNRSAIDQSRMQLLQHLIAAKLNCTGFGCSTSIRQSIANADVVYGTNDDKAIKAAIGDLYKYNKSNDNIDPPPSLGDQGSSTPDVSQAIADMVYWDTP